MIIQMVLMDPTIIVAIVIRIIQMTRLDDDNNCSNLTIKALTFYHPTDDIDNDSDNKFDNTFKKNASNVHNDTTLCGNV